MCGSSYMEQAARRPTAATGTQRHLSVRDLLVRRLNGRPLFGLSDPVAANDMRYSNLSWVKQWATLEAECR